MASSYSRHLLYLAASRGNLEDLERLCSNEEVDVNEADPEGRTPIWAAAFEGNAGVITYLLEKGGLYKEIFLTPFLMQYFFSLQPRVE